MVCSLPIGRLSSSAPFDYPDLSKHVSSSVVHAVDQLVHVFRHKCFVILYYYRLHCQFQWFGLSWQIFSSFLLRIQDICCKLPVNNNWITLDNPALGDKPQL